MKSNKRASTLDVTAELRRNPRPLLRFALIVAAYLCAFILLDFITKQFEVLPGIVAWYPPVGLTYTLLLVFGLRFTPAVTIALLFSSVFIYRMPQPFYLLLLWAIILSLIYGLAAAFLRKRLSFDWHLRKLRDVTWFICTTVLVSGFLAVLSVSSSALSNAIPRGEIFEGIFHWWIGETIGVLSVTPFLLTFVMPWLKRFADGQPVGLPALRSFPPPTLSAIGQASSIVLILYWVFGAPVLDELHPLFLIALPLLWIALTRGFKGVSAAILALNSGVVLALWLYQFDLSRLGELELLMIIICIVGLLMGVVVTERKQAEEEIVSVAKFPSENPNPVLRLSRDGIVLYANAESDELLDMWGIAVGGSVPPFWCDLAAQLLENRENKTVDVECRGKVYSMFATPIAESDYVNLYGRDVTERRRTEEALRESERELKDAQSLGRFGNWSFDLETQSITWSDQVYRLYERDPILGPPTLGEEAAYYSPEQAQILREYSKRAIEEGKSFEYDLKVKLPPGKHLSFSAKMQPIMDANGRVVKIFGTIQDVTERKRTEAEREALLEIMQGVAKTESLNELLELIRKSLAKVIQAENFFVVIKNESSGLFEEVYAVDKYDSPMPPSKLEKSITSYVFRTGEPLLLTQTKFEELVAMGEAELVGTNSAAWLGAPLKTPNETIGVMAVQNYEDPECYTEGDKEFLASVSTQVAQAIKHKQVSDKLEEERILLRTLIDNLPDRIYVLDVQGRKLISNTADWQACGGKRMEDVIGKTDLDTYPPELAKEFWALFKAVINTGIAIFNREEPGLDSQGNPVVISSSKVPLLDSQGKSAGLVGIGHDITERKQAEAALRESEEKYRNVVERANDGITIIQDTIVKYLNPRLAEMWGGTVEEVIGTPFTNFIHPDELPAVLDRYQRRIAGEQVIPTYETVLKRKDGSKVYAELNAGTILFQGEPADLVIVRDISERKVAEEALRESEEKYRGLVTEISDGIFSTDDTGTLTFANSALALMMGYENPDQLMGRNFTEFVAPSMVNELSGYFKQAMETGQFRGNAIAEVMHVDGPNRIIEVNSTAIKEGSKVVGTHNVARDITEHQQAEAEIKKQLEELKRWQNATLGREDRILDLKREVNELLSKADQTPRYPSAESQENKEK